MAPSTRQPFSGQGVLRITGFANLRVGTINVGSMVGRSREVVEMLARRQIDICAVQEVRYKGQGNRMFGDGEERYKFWWSGGESKIGGVAVMVRENWVENIIEVVRIDERMMKVKMVCGKEIISFFSTYAPQQGRTDEEKEEFREKLTNEIADVPESEVVIVAGDLNGHVGRERQGFEDVLGEFGIGQRNAEGEEILQLCQQNNMKIVNTWFKKKEEHLITYKSGDVATQIDFVLLRNGDQVRAVNCKVIPGEDCVTQHRLLCADIQMKEMTRPRRRRGEKKIKIWKLKDPNMKAHFQDKLNEKLSGQEGGWKELREAHMDAAKEVCGETSGFRKRERQTWWWREEVRQAIKEKKAAFKKWQNEKTEENKAVYREKSKQAKRAVAIAQSQAWEEWCQDIRTAEGRQKMFRLARQMKKDRQDVVGGRYVKDEAGRIQIEDKKITARWRRYFSELLNEENPYELEEVERTVGPINCVKELEVKKALRSMKQGKAPGPSGLTSEMLKAGEERGIKELTRVFQGLQVSEEIPEEWTGSFTIPIFKGKGDALQCEKYRGIRLLEHGFKIWEKILEYRLREIININECQFGFQKGRSTTDAIFIMRQVQEKFLSKNKKLYHVFVDLEKAFDRVPRDVIRWALRKQGVPERLINLVMALYKEAKSRVKTVAGTSEEFEIRVGVHQGSALSPLLFITVLEEATKAGRAGGLWEMLYADDLVLTAKTKEEAIAMFNEWKRQMETRGLKINMEKTKVMVSGKQPKERMEQGRYPCGCCGKGVGVNSVWCDGCRRWIHKRCSGLHDVKQAGTNFRCSLCTRGPLCCDGSEGLVVNGGVLEEVDKFCYLGEMLESLQGAERAVRTRIATAWQKWREIASLLMNDKIPLAARTKIYQACIRPVMLYGSETWPLTKQLERLLRSCDCRMLRYMARIRWEDRLSNEEVEKRCKVENILNKLKRQRLRWYGHVRRREESHILRRAMDMDVTGRRRIGRPKKTWIQCVKEDMKTWRLKEEDIVDRGEWRRKTDRVAG